MKKHVFGRKFKRDVDERKALFKGLMSSLVLNEKIETTESKAKAIKAEVDKLVTRAKKDATLARKLLSSKLSPEATEKMINDVAPRFNNRKGGYTRFVRLGKRFGDDSSMVLIEWTEQRKIIEVSKETKEEKKQPVKKSAVKKTVRKTTVRKEKRSTKKNGK
jgi:large subunit ribosomal protein L17